MKKFFGFTLAFLSVILFSCQKDEVGTANNELLSEKSAQITMNEVAMENAATEADYEADFYANAEVSLSMNFGMGKMWKWTNNLRYRVNNCPLVDVESGDGGYPKTITLDYGDGTELRNGKVLSGVVIIEISEPRSSADYTRLVTYQDFGVDSLLINGTALVTIDKENDVFRTFESNLTFVLADGTTIERESLREWEWVEGMDTELEQSDDMVQITGFAEAQIVGGDKYYKEIVDPLIRVRDCRYIVQGVVEISINDEVVATLDYGTGECDEVATYTSNGQTSEVDLSERKCWCKK